MIKSHLQCVALGTLPPPLCCRVGKWSLQEQGSLPGVVGGLKEVIFVGLVLGKCLTSSLSIYYQFGVHLSR